MSTIIKLRCIDQVLTFESTPVVASGGLGEDFIEVSFCSKWDGLAKTAVFWRTEADAYHVQLDENDTCPIPPEVLIDEGAIYFGLFGVGEDGKQRTSEVVRYVVTKGAITSGSKPSDPTPDIYAQLLANYAEVLNGVQEIADAAEASRQAAEQSAAAAEETVRQSAATAEELIRQAVEAEQEIAAEAEASRQAAEAAQSAAESAAAEAAQQVMDSHVNNKSNPHGVTAGQVGAAPAGKGLGTPAVAVTDLSQITGNGFYKLANKSYTGNTNPWYGWAVLENANFGYFICCSDGIYLRFGLAGGVWSTVREYINPPLQENIEYRTTERIGYKAVYLKNVGGVIQYRLDGETEWKPYAGAVGGVNKAGDTMSGALTATVLRMTNTGAPFEAGWAIDLRTAAGDDYKLRVSTDETCEFYVQPWNKARRTVLHTGNLDAHNIGQVVVGSYVGTGECGSEHESSLTFDRPPKWVAFFDEKGRPEYEETFQWVGSPETLTTEWSTGFAKADSGKSWGTEGWGEVKMKCSEDRKTIYWIAAGYTDSLRPSAQQNVSGTTYRYMAIL